MVPPHPLPQWEGGRDYSLSPISRMPPPRTASPLWPSIIPTFMTVGHCNTLAIHWSADCAAGSHFWATKTKWWQHQWPPCNKQQPALMQASHWGRGEFWVGRGSELPRDMFGHLLVATVLPTYYAPPPGLATPPWIPVSVQVKGDLLIASPTTGCSMHLHNVFASALLAGDKIVLLVTALHC